MQINDFLEAIIVPNEPQMKGTAYLSQHLAAELMERMSDEDFKQLINELCRAATLMHWSDMKWKGEERQAESNHEMWRECPVCGFDYDLKMDSKCPECALEHPLELAIVYEFNPTNKDSH